MTNSAIITYTTLNLETVFAKSELSTPLCSMFRIFQVADLMVFSGWACQNNCWSVSKSNNHETELLGVSSLPEYQISQNQVTEKSIMNYHDRGNTDRGVPLINHLKSHSEDARNFSQFALPVCSKFWKLCSDLFFIY